MQMLIGQKSIVNKTKHEVGNKLRIKHYKNDKVYCVIQYKDNFMHKCIH